MTTNYEQWLVRTTEEAMIRDAKKSPDHLMEALRKAFPDNSFHKSTFSKLKNGRRQLKAAELVVAAEFLGVPIPGATAGDKAISVTEVDTSDMIVIPIESTVRAGAFREIDDQWDAQPFFVYASRSERFPYAKTRAFDVGGDSMTEAGIPDGSTVIGVDFASSGASLHNGMTVVVERQRDGLIEQSVKVVALFPDRVEFQPRSRNPKHEPIVISRQHNGGEPNTTIRVIAIIEEVRTKPRV